ncbi:MAG: hypothetical protein EXS17_07765 [Phycisphaerales bacterium]|nr:hypothetical protein [Phycisphaerales bacterium]
MMGFNPRRHSARGLIIGLIVIATTSHISLAQATQSTLESLPSTPSEFRALPTAQNIAATITTPIAVRGGVLLVPLVRRSAQVAWPATVDLRLDDGRRIVGQIAKLVSHDVVRPQWTSPQQMIATAAAVGDSDIVLLAPLPTDGDDDIRLGEQEIKPYWMDPLPTPATQGASAISLSASDLPDATAPSEYYRTLLQAHRMGTAAEAFVGNPNDVLYARAIAGMWSAAIARLEENDQLTSDLLLSDLTGRAHGVRGKVSMSFAAWESDENELNALLRSLLAPRTDGIVLVESAKAWLEGRSPLLFWLDRDEGESVVIGAANPRSESIALTIRWQDQKSVAATVEVGPESLQFFTIERARAPQFAAEVIDESLATALREHGLAAMLPPADIMGRNQGREAIEANARAQPVLIAEHGVNRCAIQVGFGRAAVRPPGLGFGAMRPAATLAQARAGVLKAPPVEWSTSVGIRRRPSGWELLIECRAPADANPNKDEITVTCDAGFRHTVSVRSDGTVKAQDESIESGCHVHQHSDRWRVRLPLPESWVMPANAPEGMLTISVARVIEGTGSDAPPAFARRQFAGLSPLMVEPHAKGIPIDLSSWTLSSVTLAP